MAIQKTDALLLRKKDLRETSLILSFFTRDFGKINGVLKGVRGSRARGNANPLYFSLDQIVFYEKKKSDLFIISQCDTQEILPSGSPEQVRDEVKRRIDDFAPGGGFVFTQVHNIQPGVPPENIVAMFDAALEFGGYAASLP